MVKLKSFAIAALTEFLSFFLIVINTRAYTQGRYLWTMLTDGLFISQSFFVSKWMIEDKEARSLLTYFGFLVGGVAGSLVAIWLTKWLYGG